MTAADFPAPDSAPEPPPFGWVILPTRLTPNEAEQIQQQCGHHPFDSPETGSEALTVAAHIALAYARRLDPKKYPWKLAGHIPIELFVKAFPGDEQRQKSVAKAVADALEKGEEAPDPS